MLAWIDELYDTTAERTNLTSHVTTDSMWIDPASTLNLRCMDAEDPYGPDNVAVFVHIVGHIDWGWYSHTDTDCISRWIVHYFEKYAHAVYREFPECRGMFLDMLKRVYKHPHISDALSSTVTRTLLTAGVPANARVCIEELDAHYDLHVQTMMEKSNEPLVKLVFAVRSGLMPYVQDHADLVLPNIHSLMCEACRCCDMSMFQYLWNDWSRAANYPYMFSNLLSASLSVSNLDALCAVFNELDQRHISYAHWGTDLWGDVRDPRCADVLLERGCLLNTALETISHPAIVRHLILRRIPLIPSSVEVAADALVFDVHVARRLLDAWMAQGLPCMEYLCEAISVCTDPRVLTELVDILDSNYSSDDQWDERSAESLNVALLNQGDHSERFITVCLRHGADVNAQDPDTGHTLLMKLMLNESWRAIRYLLGQGPLVSIRDHAGKTVLDHFDEGRGGPWHMRHELVRRMDVERSVGSSRSNPLIVE